MTLALISNPETQGGKDAIKAVLSSCQSQCPQIGYIASEPDAESVYFKQTQLIYDALGAALNVYLELETQFDEAAFKRLLTLYQFQYIDAQFRASQVFQFKAH